MSSCSRTTRHIMRDFGRLAAHRITLRKQMSRGNAVSNGDRPRGKDSPRAVSHGNEGVYTHASPVREGVLGCLGRRNSVLIVKWRHERVHRQGGMSCVVRCKVTRHGSGWFGVQIGRGGSKIARYWREYVELGWRSWCCDGTFEPVMKWNRHDSCRRLGVRNQEGKFVVD